MAEDKGSTGGSGGDDDYDTFAAFFVNCRLRLDELKDDLEEAKSEVEHAAKIDAFRKAGAQFGTDLRNAISDVYSIIKTAINGVIGVVNGVIGVVKVAAKVIQGVFRAAFSVVSTVIRGTFSFAVATVRTTFSVISSIVRGSMSVVSGIIRTAFSPLTGAMSLLKSSTSAATDTMVGMLGAMGIKATVEGLVDFAKAAVEDADAAELLAAKLAKVLGGGAQATKQAAALVEKIDELAATTILDKDQIIDATQRLLPFSKNIDDITAKIKAIGSAAAASLGGMRAFPQIAGTIALMFSKGKVESKEMNKLARAGLDPWKVMATALGVTISKVKEMAQQGKLGSAEVSKFVDQLAKSSAGLMAKQEGTFANMVMMIKRTIKEGAMQVFKPLVDVVKPTVSRILELVRGAGFQNYIRGLADNVRAVVNWIRAAAGTAIGQWIIKMATLLASFAATKILWSVIGKAVTSVVGSVSSLMVALVPVVALTMAIQKAWRMAMDSSYAASVLEKIGQIKAALMILGETVWGALKDAWDALSAFFAKWLGKNDETGVSLQESVGKWVDKIAEFVRDAITWAATLTANYETTWELIKNSAIVAWLEIKAKIEEVVTAIPAMWETTKGKMADVWTYIKNHALAAMQAVGAFIGTAFPPIWESIADSFLAAWNRVIPKFKVLLFETIANAFKESGIDIFGEWEQLARNASERAQKEFVDVRRAEGVVRELAKQGREKGESYETWKSNAIAARKADVSKRQAELDRETEEASHRNVNRNAERERSQKAESIKRERDVIDKLESTSREQYEGTGIGSGMLKSMQEGVKAAQTAYDLALGNLTQATNNAAAATGEGEEEEYRQLMAIEERQKAEAAVRDAADKLAKAQKEMAEAVEKRRKDMEAAAAAAAAAGKPKPGTEDLGDFPARGEDKAPEKGKKEKKEKADKAEFTGIVEAWKKMQEIYGGKADPMVDQQRQANEKLDAIRAAIERKAEKQAARELKPMENTVKKTEAMVKIGEKMLGKDHPSVVVMREQLQKQRENLANARERAKREIVQEELAKRDLQKKPKVGSYGAVADFGARVSRILAGPKKPKTEAEPEEEQEGQVTPATSVGESKSPTSKGATSKGSASIKFAFPLAGKIPAMPETPEVASAQREAAATKGTFDGVKKVFAEPAQRAVGAVKDAENTTQRVVGSAQRTARTYQEREDERILSNPNVGASNPRYAMRRYAAAASRKAESDIWGAAGDSGRGKEKKKTDADILTELTPEFNDIFSPMSKVVFGNSNMTAAPVIPNPPAASGAKPVNGNAPGWQEMKDMFNKMVSLTERSVGYQKEIAEKEPVGTGA